VSVLDENGDVTQYVLHTARRIVATQAGVDALHALHIGGGLLTVKGGHMFWGETDLGAGEFIGAAQIGEREYAFALADGATGKMCTVQNGELTERFVFGTQGSAEAYFCGGYVFISPFQGEAAVYTMDGLLLRTFDENGFLAETGELGEYLTVNYISAAQERYSLLLDPQTLATVARLPGFLGTLDAETVVLDDSAGNLRQAKLRSLRELMELARERLDGRTLTPAEISEFKAG
jgi:hypothetical protein